MASKKLLAALIFTSLFSACSKSDNDATTREKILGKWKIGTIVEKDNWPAPNTITTYTGLSTDYVDYRSDGNVYYQYYGGNDTFTYRILNDNYLVQDNLDTFQIKTLTSNTFVLFHTNNSTYEYTENLYK